MSDELIIPTQSPTSRKSSTPRSRTSRPSSSISRLSKDRQEDRSAFRATKRDKRTIKHSALLSRIEKSKPSSKKRRVRRPSKKLITNLQSLVGALPDVSETKNGQAIFGDAEIKHTSLKSRPGALKKMETVIAMEKEIFNKNMARMIQHDDVNDKTEYDTGKRWAAIRGSIQRTMDRQLDSVADQESQER
ncbi:hypothetical protein MMC29_001341 [Sticta canariensis]|nr:hypothetical protein [Sticta canariensis]